LKVQSRQLAFYETRKFITVFTTARPVPKPDQDESITQIPTLFL